ncbi:hypothetical protein FACS1894109_21490 [Spirochaetia bacterium]|nr:hypothetical protein FACS1894109_21490 [Spirochaetia bacterium]
MLKTHEMIMDELKGYASPHARLTRMLKSGTLVQLRRGLFVDNPARLPADNMAVSRRGIAAALYGPSYISFQYALAAAGLIPDRVSVLTSATYNKNKDKLFRTPLGEFRYLYLPAAVYPYGITMEEEDGMSYLIATPEKALCDMVYKTPTVTTLTGINALLLEDWRMDRDELVKLDREFIQRIAPQYHKKSLAALAAWFAKEA